MQLRKLYIRGRNQLKQAMIPQPAIEASSLLANATGLDRMSIYSEPDTFIDEESELRFNEFLKRRINGEPNSYITGIKEFYSRKFIVGKDVLIPRPETELIVDQALGIIPDTGEYVVADICTGSGCIGVTLSSIRDNIKLVSTDISYPAARIARRNAKLNRSDFNSVSVNTNLLDCLKDRSLDMVVCNPPYVAEREYSGLQDEVRYFEPRGALISSEDGLWHIKEIINKSKEKLKNGGWIITEIGQGQSRWVLEMFKLCGYQRIDIILDMNNIERVIKAQWKKS